MASSPFISAAPQPLEPGSVPELATATSNTVRNEDGSYTTEASQAPVNYQDDNGEWVPISNDLVDAPGASYAVQNEANDYTVSIPDNPAVTPVKFETDAGAWVAMKLAGSEDVVPDVAGTEATFDDLVNTADQVAYEAMSTGVKETIMVGTAPSSPISFKYNLTTSPGLLPVLTEANVIEFRDSSGQVQFEMPAPNMSDSAAPEPAYSDAVTYALTDQGTTWKLVVTPNNGWLTDLAREYPVFIDPTIDKADTTDCWIQADMASSSRCKNDYVYTGLSGGSLRRGLLDFTVGWLPNNATVNSATLFLFLDATGTTGTQTANFGLYQPNDSWNENGVSWNKRNVVDTWNNGGASSATLSPTTPAINGGSSSSWYQWDVRHTVAGWHENTIINRGFMLRSTNESLSRQVRFLSGNSAGWHPILRTTYTLAPNKPTNPSVSPCTSCSANPVQTSTLQPLLGAAASDGDTSSISYNFEVWDQDHTELITSGSVPSAQGVMTWWQVPASRLDDADSYDFRMRASDDNSYGEWSNWKAFEVWTPVDSVAMTSYGVSSATLRDLQTIATQEGLTLQQAVDTYGWQEHFGELVATLHDETRSQWARAVANPNGVPGARIEFVGAPPPDVSTQVAAFAAQAQVPITIESTAKYTADEVSEMATDAVEAMRSNLSSDASMTGSYDFETDKLSITYNEPAPLRRPSGSPPLATALQDAAEDALDATHPTDAPEIDIFDAPDPVVEPQYRVVTGQKIDGSDGSMCTLGWVVMEEVTGRYGAITARHCPNDARINVNGRRRNGSLQDVTQNADWKYGDIQYHRTNVATPVAPGVFYYAAGKKSYNFSAVDWSEDMNVCFYGRFTPQGGCTRIDHGGVVNVYPDKPRFGEVAGVTVSGLVQYDDDPGHHGDSGGPVWALLNAPVGSTQGTHEDCHYDFPLGKSCETKGTMSDIHEILPRFDVFVVPYPFGG